MTPPRRARISLHGVAPPDCGRGEGLGARPESFTLSRTKSTLKATGSSNATFLQFVGSDTGGKHHMTEQLSVRGTLDVLVLKALSWGPMHGPEIIAWLEDRSSGRLAFVDSALLQ